MANFNVTGIDGLELSMEDVMELPEEVLLEMLRAEGEIVADAQRRKIQSLNLVDSGQMLESITVDKKLKSAGRYTGESIRYIDVYPRGKRKETGGSAQKATRKFKRRRKGATERVRDVTNAEVAFENEFGVPGRGIAATLWMLSANEGAADAAAEAAMKVYDRYLRSKNL